MAMRRPRIKVAANIMSSKRKLKPPATADGVKPSADESPDNTNNVTPSTAANDAILQTTAIKEQATPQPAAESSGALETVAAESYAADVSTLTNSPKTEQQAELSGDVDWLKDQQRVADVESPLPAATAEQMATRRPRVKVAANIIASKRKSRPRLTEADANPKDEESAATGVIEVMKTPELAKLATHESDVEKLLEAPQETPEVPTVSNNVAATQVAVEDKYIHLNNNDLKGKGDVTVDEKSATASATSTAGEVSVRRPRVKAAANIMAIKRKPKASQKVPAFDEPKATTRELEAAILKTDEEHEHGDTLPHVNRHEAELDTKDFANSLSSVNITNDLPLPAIDTMEIKAMAALVDEGSFKCPSNVEYNRTNSNVSTNNFDEVFQSDFEDIIQLDLHKSMLGPPMSPSKAQSRQRIRATPIFGQRRNSFVNTSPSPHTADDCSGDGSGGYFHNRRERHFSGSTQNHFVNLPSPSGASASSHSNHSPHKYAPLMTPGRIRTESSCSAFSDSFSNFGGSPKFRRNDEHANRMNSRRDFEARFNNGVPDKSAIKMSDLIYYNPLTNPMEQKPHVANIKMEAQAALPTATASEDAKPAKLEPQNDDEAAMAVPQLKLNSNGELILDDKSLEIETTAEQEARKVLAKSSLIFLDENTGMNGFYKRQKRTKEWPPEETIKFYRCLQTIGTDFSLMCQLFPQRTRRDLKLKFKKEERCNGALINKALLHPKTFNIDELKVQLETEERDREEEERRWKEIKAKEPKAVRRTHVNSSAAARILANGMDIYENENVVKTKLSKRSLAGLSMKKASNSADTPLNGPTDPSSCVGNANKPTDDGRKKRRLRKIHLEQDTTDPIVTNKPIKTEQSSLLTDDVARIVPPVDAMHVDNNNAVQYELPQLLHLPPMMEQTTSQEGMQANVVSVISAEEYNDDESLNRTLVNLDDGTVTFLDDNELLPEDITEASSSASPPPADAEAALREEKNVVVEGEEIEEISKTEPMDLDMERVVLKEELEAIAEAEIVSNSQEMDEAATATEPEGEQHAVESPKSDQSAGKSESDKDKDAGGASAIGNFDLSSFLKDFVNGTLVLVCTLDPDKPTGKVHEIYLQDATTGDLIGPPLDVPEVIIQGVLKIMTS